MNRKTPRAVFDKSIHSIVAVQIVINKDLVSVCTSGVFFPPYFLLRGLTGRLEVKFCHWPTKRREKFWVGSEQTVVLVKYRINKPQFVEGFTDSRKN